VTVDSGCLINLYSLTRPSGIAEAAEADCLQGGAGAAGRHAGGLAVPRAPGRRGDTGTEARPTEFGGSTGVPAGAVRPARRPVRPNSARLPWSGSVRIRPAQARPTEAKSASSSRSEQQWAAAGSHRADGSAQWAAPGSPGGTRPDQDARMPGASCPDRATYSS
jgi:hypothetical protein